MKKITQNEVALYLSSRAAIWSASTLKSERARLTANLALINQGPTAILTSTSIKPYAKKTLLIRAAQLVDFLGIVPNEFKQVISSQPAAIKHAYTHARVDISFEEAVKRIKSMPENEVKEVALEMIYTGLRSKEALTYDGSGAIIGKGSKPRRVYSTANLASKNVSYMQLYRALKQVDLTPHVLRKLAASKLAASGLKEADLLAVMGWSSMQTAAVYLQPLREKELNDRVNNALRGEG